MCFSSLFPTAANYQDSILNELRDLQGAITLKLKSVSHQNYRIIKVQWHIKSATSKSPKSSLMSFNK